MKYFKMYKEEEEKQKSHDNNPQDET